MYAKQLRDGGKFKDWDDEYEYLKNGKKIIMEIRRAHVYTHLSFF